MNLQNESLRIDGYLMAIADLKGDDYCFRCVYLGNTSPLDSIQAISQIFGVSGDNCRLVKIDPFSTSDGKRFSSLKNWILANCHPPSGQCLFEGLINEISDIFNQLPDFFEVTRLIYDGPKIDLGAIWNIYVFGTDNGSCAIHCSWDR